MKTLIPARGSSVAHIWPESYDLGKRLASSLVQFKSGVYAGFVDNHRYEEDAFVDALAVEYGRLLLDEWLNDYRDAVASARLEEATR